MGHLHLRRGSWLIPIEAFECDIEQAHEDVRLALGGSFFGLDAAHIMSHRYGGPGLVTNGLALTPTLHRLLDHGAWSLTDDRRIIVSADLVGADDAIENVRALHGKHLRGPVAEDARAAPEYIRGKRSASQNFAVFTQ